MKPLTLSGISSGEVEFLVAGRGVYRGFAGYHIVLLDRELNRLARLHWTPGHDLSIRFIDLDGELPDDVSGASMAGHKIVLVDEDERVFGVNLNTGWTKEIWKFSGQVTLSPCGDYLIGATDRGLLTQFFYSLEPDAPLVPADLQPLMVTGLDVFDLLVIPGDATDQFRLAIGCYGWVELVSLRHVSRRSHEAISAESRAVKTDGLPFDPICLHDHSIIAPPLYGDMVYAVDHGRANLIAIDTRTDSVFPLLETVLDYGNIQRAVASVDSTSCHVTMSDGKEFFWVPSKDPLPAEPVGGEIILWGNGRALVMDDGKTAIREIALNV